MSRDLQIPLGPYRELVLRFPEQALSEADWAVLMAVLAAMRPALVEPDVANAEILPAYSTDDLNLAARALRDWAGALEGDPEARPATIWALADRLDAHERES